ncbi:hypothetical protein [Azospirillum doebereinerae]
MPQGVNASFPRPRAHFLSRSRSHAIANYSQVREACDTLRASAKRRSDKACAKRWERGVRRPGGCRT